MATTTLSATPRRAEQRTTTVVVVIPAHNEEAGLADTVRSLRGQLRPVDRVVVVADNCTDGTAGLAAALGCEVRVTLANTAKKAGALNQVLPGLLHELDADDAVLVMDADSQLDPQFVETALASLAADPMLGAVGGVFYGHARPRASRPAAAQRVREVRARDQPTRRQGGRPHRHGDAVPGGSVAPRRRLPRCAPARSARPGATTPSR